MIDALQKASVSLGSDNVNIKKADVSNPGVPPSSLMSFLQKVSVKMNHENLLTMMSMHLISY